MRCTLLMLCMMMISCTPTTITRPKPSVARMTNTNRARVIIDAGHGGKDSGAIGKRGLKEKDITLDIALRLKRIFAKMSPNVDVVLTRDRDRYVGLEERVSVANQRRGDVFISLHIDSNESKDAHGFSVYSLDVASDRHSERLAARENKVMGKSGVDFILADLRAFSNRKSSDRLANVIAQGMKSQLAKIKLPQRIVDRGYHQAIFHVLFVKMPSVLVELFFISNPKEETMLADRVAREQIARGLFVGINKFLFESGMRAEHVARP